MEKLKYQFSSYNINALSLKYIPIVKWYFFDSELTIEKIIERAFNQYLKEKISESNRVNWNNIPYYRNPVLEMTHMIKDYIFLEFNSFTNLDWTFMENRLKKIRNFITRASNEQFNLEIENVIKKTMEKIRGGNGPVTLNEIKKMVYPDLFFRIDEGYTITELQKIS